MYWGNRPNSKKMNDMNFFEKADESLNLGMKSAKLLGGIAVGIGGAFAVRSASKRKRFELDREFENNRVRNNKVNHQPIRQSGGQAEELIFNNEPSSSSSVVVKNTSVPVKNESSEQLQQKLLDAFNLKQSGAISEDEYNVIKKQVLGF